MPDSPCHGDAQRLTPVIPAGQKPISVRLRRAVQPRHRRVSLLILKSSLLILNSGVRNNALTWSPVTESNRRPSPYHLEATRSIGVIGAGQRTLAVIYGRCRTVWLLHFAAALPCRR